MKKLLLSLLLLFPIASFAQAPLTSTGNITASGTTCATTNACVAIVLSPPQATVNVTISGTFSATLQFEQSADGGITYFAAATPSATATGLYSFAVSSVTNFRVRCSAFTSGTAGIFINATTGGSGGGGSSGSSSSSGGSLGSPVSNGIYVTTSDILWFQWTGFPGGNINHTFRIQTANCATGAATGAVYDAVAQGTAWTTNYTASIVGGMGTGKLFPVCGWLISAETKIAQAGVLQGPFGQGWILSSMPAGGNTATSVSTFNEITNGGSILFGANASSFFAIGWTVGGGSLIQSPLAGPGVPGNMSIGNPSSGVDLAATQISDASASVPSAHRIQVVAVHFRLVTAAVGGNRQPCINIGTSSVTAANALTTSCSSGIQTASQTIDYDFAPGLTPTCLPGVWCSNSLPPNFYLQAVDGYIRTTIGNIQAGDQISNIWVKTLYWNEID